MAMNRGLFAIAGGIVLAAAIALYVLLRTGDDAAVERASHGPKITEAELGKPGSRLRPISPSEPALPTVGSGTGSGSRDYMIGGVHVRDHRSGEHAELDIPPAIHPPQGRRIPSQLTYDLTQRLRGVVNECAANVPRDGRGANPRIEGEILIAIKNQQATVTGGTFQLRDADAASAAPVKACVEQKAIGVATPSGDEPELENYAITLSLRLP
jgi:hypothetical protein